MFDWRKPHAEVPLPQYQPETPRVRGQANCFGPPGMFDQVPARGNHWPQDLQMDTAQRQRYQQSAPTRASYYGNSRGYFVMSGQAPFTSEIYR